MSEVFTATVTNAVEEALAILGIHVTAYEAARFARALVEATSAPAQIDKRAANSEAQ